MLQFNFQTLFEENHDKSQKMGLKIQTNYSLFNFYYYRSKCYLHRDGISKLFN